jgi:ATP-dependent Lhr-like helicase
MFAAELRATTGRMPAEVEEGLWDLVARGLVTADGFGAVRALFSARQSWQRARRHSQRHRVPGRRLGSVAHTSEGRWALLPGVDTHVAADPELADGEALAEQVAGQLLARWGVFFWDLTARENLAVPWRELLWALRRLEARGLVRGGRFVAGCAGEQYALPEAVELLRSLRHNPPQSAPVRLSAADPLNLAGIVFPGARVAAQRGRTVTLHNGLLQTEPEPPQVGSAEPLRVS